MVAKSRGSNMQDREWWVRQGYRRDHAVHSDTDFYSRGSEQEGIDDERHNEAVGETVDISVAPTRTTNRARPRTLAAGYNYDTDTLRVVFRGQPTGRHGGYEQGAVYDYFGVSTSEWQRFQRSASPGRFITRVLDSHEYTRVE